MGAIMQHEQEGNPDLYWYPCEKGAALMTASPFQQQETGKGRPCCRRCSECWCSRKGRELAKGMPCASRLTQLS